MSGAARSHKAISETAHCQPAADIAFESFSQNDHRTHAARRQVELGFDFGIAILVEAAC